MAQPPYIDLNDIKLKDRIYGATANAAQLTELIAESTKQMEEVICLQYGVDPADLADPLLKDAKDTLVLWVLKEYTWSIVSGNTNKSGDEIKKSTPYVKWQGYTEMYNDAVGNLNKDKLLGNTTDENSYGAVYMKRIEVG